MYLQTGDKGDKEERSHTFYIRKGVGISLKEAHNFLLGRAINKNLMDKNGRKYNAWIELEFGEKDRNENYRMKLFRGEMATIWKSLGGIPYPGIER